MKVKLSLHPMPIAKLALIQLTSACMGEVRCGVEVGPHAVLFHLDQVW